MGLDLESLDLAFDGNYMDFRGKSKFQEKMHQKFKKLGKDVKKTGQKVGRFAMRVLPISAIGRGGMILALKLNVNGLATRLAPMYVDDARFKPEAVKKAKERQYNVERRWLDVGGKISPFRNAIQDGYKKKIFKFFFKDAKANSFDGYSNAVGIDDAAEIISALGIIKGVLDAFSGGDKNPYKDGVLDDSQIKDLNEGDEEFKNAKSTTLIPKGDGNFLDPQTGQIVKKDEALDENISKESNPDNKENSDKFLGMPKKVGIGVTIGVGVLLITSIFVALARRK